MNRPAIRSHSPGNRTSWARSATVARQFALRSHVAGLFGCVGAMGLLLLLSSLFPETGLSDDGREPIERGRELFTREWKPQQPDRTHGDGLGPYFNERSCAACHKMSGVGGAGPNDKNVQLVAVRFVDFKLAEHAEQDALRAKWFPHAEGGVMVVHRHSTLPDYADLRLTRLELAAPDHPEVASRREKIALRLPDIYGLGTTQKGLGPASERIAVATCGFGLSPTINPYEERNTPALFGAGAIDRVSIETLEQTADRQPEGIRGRVPRLPGGDVGRFGWKAQNATLFGFCENACAVELGLETSRRKQTPGSFVKRHPGDSRSALIGPKVPDVSNDEVAAMAAFAASLARPRQMISQDDVADDVRLGELKFAEIGCAECHTRDLGDINGLYSDLLLHRVGTSGSVYYQERTSPIDVVNGSQFIPPAADEFRTPPLWGVADSAPYLHDGSAPTLDAAISRHSGQARLATMKYQELGPADQRRVLAFLGTLRAP